MTAQGVDLINQIQEPVWVQGNTIQFEQVLINMVNNARDAILDASASGAVTLRQTLEDGFVTVMIEDTGGGIPPGIVQDMQGTIWAENVGEGARISIRLPIYSKEKETVAEMGQ
jgi:C4-dicarboxylate-specific signal transduction histidine kinase